MMPAEILEKMQAVMDAAEVTAPAGKTFPYVGLTSGDLASGVLVDGPEDCLRRVLDIILAGYRAGLVESNSMIGET
jgi:hypothetical protein|tara:strand:+ start:115 stop:342 length:228 start_codon:yes stop_codon:yes gene_type:complete